MFFHGINYENLLVQYPILSPVSTKHRGNQKQKKDREHLIERFGFEPIHLIESSRSFPVSQCLKTCFNYGSLVFMFNYLKTPVLQLSENEIGVPKIDVRKAKMLFIIQTNLISKALKLFNDKPIYLIIDKEFFKKGVLINKIS